MMDENIESNNNYTGINLDNQFYTVEWFIDTTPDYNLTNNYQVSNYTETIMNNSIINFIEYEFMPSNPKKNQRISIDVEVCGIVVSEEDRNCCICYEIKEYKDISQINCGHKFCGTCIIDHISINYINPCCPLCREKIIYITFQRHFYEADFKKYI
jgi:hypothetical protein